jgi:hypothetical protein
MSDYLPCPNCHGSGLVPPERAIPKRDSWKAGGYIVLARHQPSHHLQRCAACGQDGAVHTVLVKRSDGSGVGGASFCTSCRPAQGTLPPWNALTPA